MNKTALINQLHEVVLPLLENEANMDLKGAKFEVEKEASAGLGSVFISAEQKVALKFQTGSFNFENNGFFVYKDKPVVTLYTKGISLNSFFSKKLFIKNVVKNIAHEYCHYIQFLRGDIVFEKFIKGDYSFKNTKQYKELVVEKEARQFERYFWNTYCKVIMEAID